MGPVQNFVSRDNLSATTLTPVDVSRAESLPLHSILRGRNRVAPCRENLAEKRA